MLSYPIIVLLAILELFGSATAIPFDKFIGYPFGEEYGDQTFPRKLDAFVPVNLTCNPFHFFGKYYSYINVSYRDHYKERIWYACIRFCRLLTPPKKVKFTHTHWLWLQ